MFDYEYWQEKNNSKELTIGWLYNNQIKDDFAKGYTKNLTDYWSVELAHFFSTQFADETVYDLLKKAYDNGFSNIIVFKQGCTLRGPNFLPELKTFLNENNNIKFIGHILDRQEGYYEVHPQTFYINLNWWAEAGFPEWGERTWDSNLETLEPTRSEENHHDQYTPHWIAPSKNLKTYQGQRGEGWNIVKSLIESGEKILSWPRSIRIAKQYAYAEVENDGPRHRAELFTEIISDSSVFIANTENFIPLDYWIKRRQDSVFLTYNGKIPKHTWSGNFQQIVIPAAGISTLVYAFKLGLKAGHRIFIYDKSKYAIDYTNHLLNNWDGNIDYIEFAEQTMNNGNIPASWKGIKQLPDTQKLINDLNKEGFSDWIKNELPGMKIKTKVIDIFDFHKIDHLLNMLDDTSMTYFHFTNIFHYAPTSFYYSLKQKWQLSNDLLFKIKKKYTKNNALIYLAKGRYEQKVSPIFWIDDADTREFSEISDMNIFRLLKWNK